jgi:capsular exopolysaccharide synthesis family protein
MATQLQLPEQGPVTETDFDVRYYLELLWRQRLLVAASAIVGLGLGLLVAFLQVPEYRAATLLQIEPPVPSFLSVNEAAASVGAGGYWQNTDFYNTQFKILTSKSVGELVIDRLKLRDREPFKSSPDAAALLMSQVRVEPVPDSRLASVVVIHETPTEAALWANTIADEYIAVTLANRVDAAKRAYTWLQERLAATQREMRDAQDKLFRSYQSQDLFVPEGSVSAVSRSITKLNEDYVAATSRRIEIEAALKQAITMREQGLGLDQIPQIAHDAQVAGFNGQLVSQSLELARLKEKFKEGHPEVQKLLGQIEHVRKAKDARALEIIEGLRAEYAQLQKRETELRAATDKQKATAASQSRRVTELETLKKEAESAKSLYDVLLQKLNESDIAASIRSNNVTIVERASPPRTPVKPDKRRMAAVALVMGLALGVGLVLGRDYLDNTIKDPEEVERYLHLDLLASVPRYEDGSAHLVTEAYQNLRTALIFARRSEGGQVVLVTGSVPQEGKTTTLVNIGKLLAASGERTIVLDFDLRRATLHTQLGLLREPGLTNYFVSHDDLNVLIRPTRVANLYALTAGPIPPNPPALLARRELTALIAELRQHFDWILLDSPPLASVTDALLLARHADLAVMVVRHNKVDKKLVKRSVVALRRVTPNLLGAVLNAVDAKGKGYHYYYHYRAQDTPVSKQAAG